MYRLAPIDYRTNSSLKNRRFTVGVFGLDGNIYVSFPVFSEKKDKAVQIDKILYQENTGFQNVLIVKTVETDESGEPFFDLYLLLDGGLQFAQSDYTIYDHLSFRFASHRTEKRILVLGGGDCNIANSILKERKYLDVTVVDLDSKLVELCKKHFPKREAADNKIEITCEDALVFLENSSQDSNMLWDAIICDLTDVPINSQGQIGYRSFYESLIPLCKKSLSPKGWISIQAGPPRVCPARFDTRLFLEELLKRYFPIVFSVWDFIPSYGEDWAFVYGLNK